MAGLARSILGSAPVRALTRVAMAGAGAAGRLASFCRARALFPGAPTLVCHWTTDVKYPENIRLGREVVIGTHCSLGAHSVIELGDRVRLSRGVVIETAGLDFVGSAAPYPHLSAPVVLAADVWVGAGAMILGGVSIGRGAVIAGGAVVSRDVPAHTVVAGVPARPVKALHGAAPQVQEALC